MMKMYKVTTAFKQLERPSKKVTQVIGIGAIR